ncbi:hypothetical protein WEI85_02425 [Actinomycetes bacterium KLBMP 9797]
MTGSAPQPGETQAAEAANGGPWAADGPAGAWWRGDPAAAAARFAAIRPPEPPVPPTPIVTLPVSTEPPPAKSSPVEPAPVEPAAVEPAAVEPAPVDSAAVDSASVESAPVEPALAGPALVRPASVELASAGTRHVVSALRGHDELASAESTSVEAALVEAAPVGSASVEAALAEPGPMQAASVERESVEAASGVASVKPASGLEPVFVAPQASAEVRNVREPSADEAERELVASERDAAPARPQLRSAWPATIEAKPAPATAAVTPVEAEPEVERAPEALLEPATGEVGSTVSEADLATGDDLCEPAAATETEGPEAEPERDRDRAPEPLTEAGESSAGVGVEPEPVPADELPAGVVAMRRPVAAGEDEIEHGAEAEAEFEAEFAEERDGTEVTAVEARETMVLPALPERPIIPTLAATPEGEELPFWLPTHEVARPARSRRGGARRVRRLRRPPRSPAVGLSGLLVLALLATFFAWVSAEPLWLAVGHGDTGTATVSECTGAGARQRCVGEFTAAGGAFTAEGVRLVGVASTRSTAGSTVTARMVAADSGRAYVGDDPPVVHLRWALGLVLLLLCGLGIVWITGATRLEDRWSRRTATVAGFGAPLLVAVAFLAATF